jgi:cytochrome P450
MSNVLNIPGPRYLSGPFGATLRFFKDPIRFLDRAFKNHGEIIGVRTAPMATPPQPGYPGTVFLYGPALIKNVSQDYDSFYRMAMSHRLYPIGHVTERQKSVTRIMTGLTHMQKADHQRHRSMIGPLLSKKAVTNYFSCVRDVTDKGIHTWKPGTTRDLSRDMLELTLRISARTLFGESFEKRGFELGLLVEDWIRFVMSPGHLFPYDIPGMPYRAWLSQSQEIEKRTKALVHTFLDHPVENTLLSMMIDARDGEDKGMTRDELVGHVSLLMWGSRDAVANAIVWTLFLLTQHQKIYADVVSEMQGVLHGDAPTLEQLDKMPLLESIIKESLRLFPPFPITHRVTGKEREIAGYTIPVRTEIGMSVYHTHRMLEIYDEPYKFKPDRWNLSAGHSLPFFSFGVGPRGCVGFNFGWQEMLTILPMILQKYRLALPNNARIDREIKVALIPKRGMPMIIQPMDGEFHSSVGKVKGNIRDMVELDSQ